MSLLYSLRRWIKHFKFRNLASACLNIVFPSALGRRKMTKRREKLSGAKTGSDKRLLVSRPPPRHLRPFTLLHKKSVILLFFFFFLFAANPMKRSKTQCIVCSAKPWCSVSFWAITMNRNTVSLYLADPIYSVLKHQMYRMLIGPSK